MGSKDMHEASTNGVDRPQTVWLQHRADLSRRDLCTT
jgi:hypothetical protein